MTAKKIFAAALAAGFVFFGAFCGIGEASRQLIDSSHAADYRGAGGVTRTTYIDTNSVEWLGVEKKRGGVLKVSVIEVWEWENHKPKRQKTTGDYYFYRRMQNVAHSLRDGAIVEYFLSHEIPGKVVQGAKGDGQRCIMPSGKSDGQEIFRDELIDSTDKGEFLNKILQAASERVKK